MSTTGSRSLELRYLLAVVTGAGAGAGRAVALALGRAGAAVLAADAGDLAAAATAREVQAARVRAWSLQVDPGSEVDVRMLAARAQDLGGADLLVLAGPPGPHDPLLADLVVTAALARDRRRPGTPAVVQLRRRGVAGGAAGSDAGEVRVATVRVGDDETRLVREVLAHLRGRGGGDGPGDGPPTLAP